MKIYNEVVSRFNEITGLWETISEDSFEYNGEMALAQGIPPNASPINSADTIADTIKTTAGYFTNGDGTLAGNLVYTGSLSATNEKCAHCYPTLTVIELNDSKKDLEKLKDFVRYF